METANGFVFDGGVAGFWHAREAFYSAHNKPSYIISVLEDLNPWLYQASFESLTNPEKYGIASYNFAIVQKEGYEFPLGLSVRAREVLPQPAKVAACEGNQELWLYSDLSLDSIVRKNIASLRFQYSRESFVVFFGADFPGNVGRSQSNFREANEAEDSAGYFSFGPYITLNEGRYMGTIFYEATDDGNTWDVGVFTKLFSISHGKLSPDEEKFEFIFDLENPTSGIEVRTFYGGKGSFRLHSVKLQKID